MRLEDWLNPALIEDGYVADRAGDYETDPLSTVIIDDFLAPEPLEGLRALFERDGVWADRYVLKGDPLAMPETTLDRWSVADRSQRFSSQLALEGPVPGREISQGLVHHVQFARLAGTDLFLNLLGHISSMDVTLEGTQARIMLSSHQMSRHTDFGNGRALCAVLYVHRFWQESFDGRFLQYKGDELVRGVSPLPNRLVLFGTSGGSTHEVEPMSAEAGGRQRWSYSLWYRCASPQIVGEF
jgi:hypothetical protein